MSIDKNRSEGILLLRIVIVIWALLLTTGCASGNLSDNNYDKPASFEDGSQGPILLTTPQVVEMLEREAIAFISTAHDQSIYIELKNGKTYQGIYRQAESGRYSKEKRFYDILNLASYILENRPKEEVKDIIFEME